ncbi:uncharacterized protein LOC125320976 [Corvus hawaiiensis]|uniref:uncharacterized protein LOC125320976 n=1 Tax=Corvus hawaiiensis TaxID=134902 RepID=UPI002019D093|nr:uncharacterized protein LOC125320976 [Corvus hawaiiensis]
MVSCVTVAPRRNHRGCFAVRRCSTVRQRSVARRHFWPSARTARLHRRCRPEARTAHFSFARLHTPTESGSSASAFAAISPSDIGGVTSFPTASSNSRNELFTFPKESHLGHNTVRDLKVWSDITPLNFHEVAGNNADIQTDFSKADHNDGCPFDRPGGTVAHAFFPGDHHTAGDTHFDDDEYWTLQLSGVRESVSPTAKPEVSETDDHPILPELPENHSTVL